LEQDAVIVRDAGGGRVVVAGVLADDKNVLVARLRADGSLDPTFGRGGVVLLKNLWILDEVEVRADGKVLLMADVTTRRTAIYQLDADGGLDASFGSGGRVLLPAPSIGEVSPETGVMAVQADGRILAAERGNEPAGGILISRYRPDGSPDSTFGSGGTVIWSGPALHTPWPDSIGATADGGVQMVLEGFDDEGFMISRYRADGSPDPAFGDGRIVMAESGGYPYFLATLSDGRVLTNSFWNNRISMYAPDGSPEGAFTVEAPTSALQLPGSDGNRLIFASNPEELRTGGQFALLAFTTDGLPDTSFGDAGRLVISDDAGIRSWWMQLSAASDGGLIEAHLGEAGSPDVEGWYPTELVINRVDASGRPVETFGSHGRVVFRLEGTGPADSEVSPAPDDPAAQPPVEEFTSGTRAGARDLSPFSTGDDRRDESLNRLLNSGFDASLFGSTVEDLLRES
jgi:uncharacterized delta-60 repeat protein